jgi:hypothetical protein
VGKADLKDSGNSEYKEHCSLDFSKERKGKERKGKERKGKERKGKERKGKERKGKEGEKVGW